MDLKLSKAYEQTLDEIDMLEFQIDGCRVLDQRVRLVAALVKKLYLADMLKIMMSVENELSESDSAEFRKVYFDFEGRIDSIAHSVLSGKKFDCNDSSLDILEKMAPYLKGYLKKIMYYKKSRQIQIVA